MGTTLSWCRSPGQSVLYPVPYDFDFSGLVDASYARPDPRCRSRAFGSGFIAACAERLNDSADAGSNAGSARHNQSGVFGPCRISIQATEGRSEVFGRRVQGICDAKELHA
jgi:hypothetical protein